MKGMIGAVHDSGVYYFAASEDYMDEGENEVAALNTQIIKVELDAHDLQNSWTSSAKYPWHSSWPSSGSSTTVLSISQTSYFRNLFANPNFTTYVMTVYCPNVGTSGGGENDEYWTNGTYPNNVSPVPAADLSAETTQIQNLCANLLASYSGKTFVIENWEADSALQDIAGASVTSPVKVNANLLSNMTAWINARCTGVHNAMANKGSSTSNCYCAYEVNVVKYAIEETQGTKTCSTGCDDVLPNTSVDYASYSSYDSMMVTSGNGTYSFNNCMNWIALHCPSTALHGKTIASVGIGEFGCANNWQSTTYNTNLMLNNVFPVVINDATPYCCLWNIYDNDLQDTAITPPVNGNDLACTGFWMIRPDGNPDTAWHTYRWQTITTDPVRYSTSLIKNGLPTVYTSVFSTSGLGTGWTTSGSSTYYTFTPASGSLTISLANGGSSFPKATATCDVATVSSLGRGLEAGEYAEMTMDRSATGFMGYGLFSSAVGCNDASGVQPWSVYTGSSTSSNGWQPISWYWNTEYGWTDNGNSDDYGTANPTENFNTTNTIGFRLDSADGVFATVAYYLNGSYMGSWLMPETATVLNDISIFTQDDNSGTETFTFGNLSVYQQ